MKQILFFTILFLSFNSNGFTQTQSVSEDSVLIICDIDIAGGILVDTFYICQNSFFGNTLIVNDSCIEYTPNPNYFGYDSICITKCIGAVCNDEIINVTIKPAGDRINVTTTEDINISVCENIISGGSDVDNIVNCTPPLYSANVIYGNSCVDYTPSPNFIGVDSFCIVSCLDTLCDTSTLIINISPVTETITRTTPGNQEITICLTDFLTVVDSVTQISNVCPSNGTTTIDTVNNCITFLPDSATYDGSGVGGTETICATVCNSQGVCDTTNITLAITPVIYANCAIGSTLFDSGGNNGTYSDNEDYIITVCPGSPGFGVFTTMDLMGIQQGDQIMIYNGNSTVAPTYPDMPLNMNTAYNIGTQFQSTVGNPTGCLTFEFMSNGDGSVGNFEFGLTCDARCQEVRSYIGFSNPDTVHEDGEVYINICLGDTLDIIGNALFPENNVEYTQSEASSTFSWNWGDNSPHETGQSKTHYYAEPGGYILDLEVEDLNGCLNYQNQVIKVRVAPIPEFLALEDTLLCLDQADTLTAYPVGDFTTGDQFVIGDTLFFQPPLFSGDSIFLPDGNGAGYNTSVNISSFPSNATIQNCQDILNVCINMEHSFAGDLEISLTCPNGQTAILHAHPSGGGTYIGNALDDGSLNPGTGLEYCFNSSGTTILANGNVQPGAISPGNTFVPGNYLPVNPFTNFVGCPINGQWTLNITDNLTVDNGYIFNWELDIDQCQYPEIDTFTMVYDLGYWESHPIITGINVDSNSIIVEPDSVGLYTLTYVTENQFGCQYSHDYDIFVEGFDVIATPEDTTVCVGESVQLNAEVDGANITCAPDYFSYEIPYYKETGTIIPFNFTNQDNGASASIPLPFPFKYFCTNPVSFRAFVDGYIGINSNSGFSVPNNSTIPSTNPPNNLIALMWDDLVDSTQISGYFVTGTTPNQKLVVEFNLLHNGGTTNTEPVIGQIILHEATGAIDIICENCQQDVSDPTASQGMENFTASAGIVTPGRDNSAWSATQNAIRFYPKSSLNTDYTIAWTPNNTLVGDSTQAPFASPTVSTEYAVEITNNNGCNSSDTVNVRVGGDFTREISNDTTICKGKSVQLSVTGGAETFAWTPNDGSISDTTIANPIFTPDTTTTYTVALDSTNSCTAFESVTIEVSVFNVDSTLTTNEICFGDTNGSIEIFVTNSADTTNYSIDGGVTFATTNLFTNLSPNIYDVVVQGGFNCDTAYQVEIFGNPEIVIDSIASINPSCANTNDGVVTIHVQGGAGTLNYSIDNGATFQASNSFTNLTGGTYNIIVQDSLSCFIDTNHVVTQPSPIIIQIVQNDSLSCFNDNNGIIEISASGGVGTLVYSIDRINFGTATTFTGLTADTYTVYVRDDNMCLDSLDIVINQPDSLFITNVVVDSTNCFGASLGSLISFDAQGGTTPYTFAIDGATFGNNNTFNDIPAGNYQLLVTDANGCLSNQVDTIVSEPTLLEFILDSTINATCGLDNGAIYVRSSGGSSPYTYNLNGGANQNNGNFTNLATGNYNVLITDVNGCDTSQNIIVNSIPPAEISLVNVDSVSCFGLTDGLLEVQADNGSSPFEFSIDDGVTYQVSGLFNALAADNYTIILRDSIGCTDTLAQAIEQPTEIILTAITDSTSCFGLSDGEITLNATGGNPTYQFSITNDADLQNNNIYANLVAATYNAYVVDTKNCRDSITINVEQPDSLFITNIVVDSTNCFGASLGSLISFDAQGGTTPYTFAIDGATFGNNNTFNDIPAGNYQLLVTDANGCLSNQVDTIVSEPTLLEFILDSTINATCGLDNGAIYVRSSGGSSPYTYNLNGGANQNNGNFTNLATGNYNVLITDVNGCDTSQNIIVNSIPPAEISLVNVDSVSCFGLTDGLLEVQADNGSSPFEFSIDDGVTYQVSGLFNALAADNYTIILRDSIGCTDTLAQAIEQPTEIILTAITDSTSCFGLSDGEITLNATGGNPTYQFSITNDADLQNNNIYANLVAATYNAYVVDTKNCRDSITVNIEQPDTLVIASTIATDISCFGDDNGSIEVNVSGGTQAYTYSIDSINFQNSNVLDNLDSGTYTVHVLDANNCSASAVDSINEPADLTLGVASSINIICNNGSDGSIEVMANGGVAPYQFSIDGVNFQNSTIFNNLVANNYTITVRDNNNCTETVAQTLTQPNQLNVIIDSTNLLCFGDTDGSITITSVSGETAPYSVVFDGGTAQNYIQGMTFNNLSAGTYNITISDVNNCPVNGFSKDVVIESPSLFEITSVAAVDPLCFGGNDGSITVITNGGGVPAYSFNIFDGMDTTSNLNGEFNDLQEGVYAIWVVDQNGCTSQATDSLVAPDELILNIDSVLDPSCFAYNDGFIQVSAEGGTPFNTNDFYTFLLDDETIAQNGFFIDLNEDLYDISVTDANECTTVLQVQLQDPEPVIAEILPQDTLVEMGDTLSLSVVLTNAEGTDFIYAWTPNEGLSCTDCSNPVVTVYNDEEFTLTFYDENGCFTTTSSYIEVSDTLRYFIPNAFTPGSFDEVNNVFKVYGQDIKFADMIIFNRWGEKIFETANALEGWDGTYQNIVQNPGVYTYFIRITFLNDDFVEEKGSVTLLR